MYWLYEYGRNVKFGPASKERVEQYEACLKAGQKYFLYPYHGYNLAMTVRKELE